MSGERNGAIPTNAADYFQQAEKRAAFEERRPRITKASDLLGPLSGPSAVSLNDSLNSDLMLFNGLFVIAPGTPESPDDTKWWMGESIAQDGIGGVQILYTFRPADAPHRVMMRGWETVVGTGGLRAYSDWQSISEPEVDTGWVSVTGIAPYTVAGGAAVRRVRNHVWLKGFAQRAVGHSAAFEDAVQLPDPQFYPPEPDLHRFAPGQPAVGVGVRGVVDPTTGRVRLAMEADDPNGMAITTDWFLD